MHPVAEKACRQGRGPPRLAPCHSASGEGLSTGVGCCPAPGGNDWPPTFGSSRGTKAAKGDAELLTPALGSRRDDTHCCTAERFASVCTGKCRPLRPDVHLSQSSPPLAASVGPSARCAPGGACRCPRGGHEVCAGATRHAHAGVGGGIRVKRSTAMGPPSQSIQHCVRSEAFRTRHEALDRPVSISHNWERSSANDVLSRRSADIF